MYSLWQVAGDKAEIWDVAAAHINVVVAFLQMSASWFINGVWFRENLKRKRIKDEKTGRDGRD